MCLSGPGGGGDHDTGAAGHQERRQTGEVLEKRRKVTCSCHELHATPEFEQSGLGGC